MLLCTHLVQANEIAEKEEVAETDSKVVKDSSEIVIDCQTFLVLQQEWINEKSSLENVIALIPFLKLHKQRNIAKLAKTNTESKTKEEFDKYRQIIRKYQEMIITLEQQQAELEKNVTLIAQNIELIRKHLPSCEEEYQTE